MPARLVLSFLLLGLGLTLAACGSRGPAQSSRPVSAVATTTQVADFVRQVGGRRVDVRQVLQPNSDPHDYEPRPSDARQVEGAELVVRSGGDLDDWMKDLIDANGGGARTVTLIDAVRTRPATGGTDPHWWQDPRNAERAIARIRAALVAADPGGRAGYERRAAAYTARLRRLDAAVASCIGRIPASERALVTSHDALGYYTHRYGLRLVGAVIPSQSSQAQPSSRDIGRLVDQIRRERVKAIFPESSLNPKLERAVARESGATVGRALWADTLGPAGSRGATYAGSIESNTQAIAEGVTGGAVRCRFEN